jgi:hypothetical protein
MIRFFKKITATMLRDDRSKNRGSFLAVAETFLPSSLLPGQFWVHPASYPICIMGAFLGGKAEQA